MEFYRQNASYILSVRGTAETFTCSCEICIPVFLHSSNNLFSITLVVFKQSSMKLSDCNLKACRQEKYKSKSCWESIKSGNKIWYRTWSAVLREQKLGERGGSRKADSTGGVFWWDRMKNFRAHRNGEELEKLKETLVTRAWK